MFCSLHTEIEYIYFMNLADTSCMQIFESSSICRSYSGNFRLQSQQQNLLLRISDKFSRLRVAINLKSRLIDLAGNTFKIKYFQIFKSTSFQVFIINLTIPIDSCQELDLIIIYYWFVRKNWNQNARGDCGAACACHD